MTIEDAREILGLDDDATQGDLKRAFRRLAKLYHPDRTGEEDSTEFREAKDAYDVLVDILPAGPAKPRRRRTKGSRKPTRAVPPPLMRFSSRCNACHEGLWAATPIQLKDRERGHMKDNVRCKTVLWGQPQPHWYTRRYIVAAS